MAGAYVLSTEAVFSGKTFSPADSPDRFQIHMVSLVVGDTTVDLDATDLPQLYEALWSVAVDQRGAVIAAARLHHLIVSKDKPNPVTFEGNEATAVRAALDRIGRL